MKKPTLMRLDQGLIDQIEAYRVREGLKSTSEATRRLITLGLAAPMTAAAAENRASTQAGGAVDRSISRTLGDPAKSVGGVPWAGDLPRRGAMPKKGR